MESKLAMNDESNISEGYQWLKVLGLTDYADVATNHKRADGSVINLGDFHEICGEHVRPLFESLPKLDDVRADRVKSALSQAALGYIQQVNQ